MWSLAAIQLIGVCGTDGYCPQGYLFCVLIYRPWEDGNLNWFVWFVVRPNDEILTHAGSYEKLREKSQKLKTIANHGPPYGARVNFGII